LLASQNGNARDFLRNDPRERALPGFLVKLADHIDTANVKMQEDVSKLVEHVEHIKEIVSTQQSYARVMGVIELAKVSELVETAVKLCQDTVTKHQVELTCDLDPDLPSVSVDRHKVVQILVNLLVNAKDSMKEAGTKGRKVCIESRLDGDETIRITVTDNGLGLERAHLSQVFRHGFTTKVNGHGFGLHMSAIAARELGGSLHVQSDGPGMGAIFTLTLPAIKNIRQ